MFPGMLQCSGNLVVSNLHDIHNLVLNNFVGMSD